MTSSVIIVTLLLLVMREAASVSKKAFKKAVLRSHNSYRQKAGLPPLVWSDKLEDEMKNSAAVSSIKFRMSRTMPNSDYLKDGEFCCRCPSEAHNKIKFNLFNEEHDLVVRAFGLYWGGSRFETLSTHCNVRLAAHT